MQKKVVVVCPLGRGYQSKECGEIVGVCTATRIRIDRALVAATAALKASPEALIVIIVAPGRERSRTSGPTMARFMVRYLDEVEAIFPVICNDQDPAVYGTLGEIEWVMKTAAAEFPDYERKFVFTSAYRHDSRIKRIVQWFFPGTHAQVVTSADPKIPLYHEALAYTKLALIKLGARTSAEWFRHATARPIKEV